MSSQAFPMKVLRSVWRALDRVRKVLHLVLLLGFFLVLVAGLAGQRIVVPRATALVIAPQGALVDQLSGDPFERAFAKARGLPLQETLLRDVIEAIRRARDDERIKVLVLRLDGLTGAGLSKLQELARELTRFKESGKQITALGDGFTRDQYYLAAYADDIYMHPMGIVLVDGYSRYLPYYKSALDKLYVDYNVWTVGEYKSFVEPITRDDMSPEDEEASREYLQALWSSYQKDVTDARELPAEALQRYADQIADLLAEVGGNTARLALDYGLVDELMPHDVMRERIRGLVGESIENDDDEDFKGIDFDAYLTAVRAESATPQTASKIAVVVASGTILDGAQPPGTVGGETAAGLIRQAARDEQVKALVVRVDSPGGSAFASDIILRELEVFQSSERPVVVSMGSVAASGGYWISMAADEIWASPTTLTGSIGVGATLPTIQRTLDRVGVHVDGIATTELAGGFDVMRGINDEARGLIGQSVRYTYDQFIGKVAEHRNRAVEEIDRVARGRVWIGSNALDRGLVDRLGTFADAVGSAAELAGLAEDDYRLDYVEQELGVAERLLLELTATASPLVRGFGSQLAWPAAVSRWLEATMEPLAFVQRLNDPRGIYAYCFCDVR
jgi:protease IV